MGFLINEVVASSQEDVGVPSCLDVEHLESFCVCREWAVYVTSAKSSVTWDGCGVPTNTLTILSHQAKGSAILNPVTLMSVEGGWCTTLHRLSFKNQASWAVCCTPVRVEPCLPRVCFPGLAPP